MAGLTSFQGPRRSTEIKTDSRTQRHKDGFLDIEFPSSAINSTPPLIYKNRFKKSITVDMTQT
jgi:hypothetical protein